MSASAVLLEPVAASLPKPGTSVVRQVVQKIKDGLAAGAYTPGTRLPSERTLARELNVGRKTVTAAYEQLEDLGVLRRFRGKGAFVCLPLDTGAAFSWSGKISAQAHVLDEPVLELIAPPAPARIEYPLSAGTPSLEVFPQDAFRAAMDRVLAAHLPGAVAVAPAEGQPRLREAIAGMMHTERSRVMVTLGAQEGVDLIARCLIDPGEHAVIESPTYPGAIQSLRAAGARLVCWDRDWSLEQLESLLLTHRPKLIFTSPTFQNPTGRTMPLKTRKGLLELAARYHVPIIEDDVYSRAPLTGAAPPPSLYSLDQQNVVAYVSTFSKVLAPGLRIGWVTGPTYLIKQLSLMKMRANLFTEGIQQLVVADMIESGAFASHLTDLIEHHTRLRDVAVAGLQGALGQSLIEFEVPQGGLYLWCRASTHVDLELAFDDAHRRGLAVAPGQAFYARGEGQRHFRLCFTAAPAERIRRGTALLTEALERAAGDAPAVPRESAARRGMARSA